MSWKSMREAAGFTQADVVWRLNHNDVRCDVSLLSKIENGMCLPTEDMEYELRRMYRGDERAHMTTAESLVYFAIPKGKANRVTRQYLCAALNMKDREVRRIINALRLRGLWVLSYDGAGYWRSEDPKEVAIHKRVEKARAKSITDAVANM